MLYLMFGFVCVCVERSAIEAFFVLWNLAERASRGCMQTISKADQRSEGKEDKKIVRVKDGEG